MSATPPTPRRLSVVDIAKLYTDGVRIPMLTAYDFPTARLLDEAGIPLILVGDSVGQVILGYETTVRVTMAEMVHHTKAVVRGSQRALVVADMPFLSYSTPAEALENAGTFLRDAGAQAVKVEGGARTARIIETLVRAGIPVMGHIGLTPQAINAIGKVRVQGKSRDQARALMADAQAVQEAGAFAMVLELVPEQLAAAITDRLRIPTIGIGAGAGCSGQVQVITDLIGLGDFSPRHARPVRARPRDDPGGCPPTRPTWPPARSPARRRPSGWTTRCSTRCSVAVRRTGRRTCSRLAAFRSIATSECSPKPLDPDRSNSRRAPGCPRRRGAPGRGGPHDGLAARRPSRPHAAGSGGRRHHGRDDLRQSASVQRRRRLHEVPAQRGPRPRDLRGGGRRSRLRPRRARRSTRRGSTRSCRSARSRSRWKAPRVPGISTASRPSSRSCSGWSAPTTPTSGRRTRSR